MNARNANSQVAIDSASMAWRFCLAGGLTGILITLVVQPLATTANFVRCVGWCSSAGFVVWMTVLAAVYRRRFGDKQRQGRAGPAQRRRTQLPPPHADRLAHFFSHAPRPTFSSGSDPSFPSRMRFWTICKWPASEPTPPKPVWFIRRLLHRIRDAVHGSENVTAGQRE